MDQNNMFSGMTLEDILKTTPDSQRAFVIAMWTMAQEAKQEAKEAKQELKEVKAGYEAKLEELEIRQSATENALITENPRQLTNLIKEHLDASKVVLYPCTSPITKTFNIANVSSIGNNQYTWSFKQLSKADSVNDQEYNDLRDGEILRIGEGSDYLFPIIKENNLIGVIKAIDSKKPEEYYKMHSVYGTKFKNLNSQIESTSKDIDLLTGLLSKSSFEGSVQDGIYPAPLLKAYEAAQQGEAISCVFGDADLLKLANDIGGHELGDALLRTIAQEIKANTRAGIDFCGKPGGDEFKILLVGCDAKKAAEIAFNIQCKVAQHIFTETGHVIAPSLTMGVKEISNKNDSKVQNMSLAEFAEVYTKAFNDADEYIKEAKGSIDNKKKDGKQDDRLTLEKARGNIKADEVVLQHLFNDSNTINLIREMLNGTNESGHKVPIVFASAIINSKYNDDLAFMALKEGNRPEDYSKLLQLRTVDGKLEMSSELQQFILENGRSEDVEYLKEHSGKSEIRVYAKDILQDQEACAARDEVFYAKTEDIWKDNQFIHSSTQLEFYSKAPNAIQTTVEKIEQNSRKIQESQDNKPNIDANKETFNSMHNTEMGYRASDRVADQNEKPGWEVSNEQAVLDIPSGNTENTISSSIFSSLRQAAAEQEINIEKD